MGTPRRKAESPYDDHLPPSGFLHRTCRKSSICSVVEGFEGASPTVKGPLGDKASEIFQAGMPGPRYAGLLSVTIVMGTTGVHRVTTCMESHPSTRRYQDVPSGPKAYPTVPRSGVDSFGQGTQSLARHR